MSPSRLHALIDGVFAIALTLLVLDLPRPSDSTRLAHDLLHQWPSYAAYLVSFVTIGILWIEHHGMMSAARHINRRFLERTWPPIPSLSPSRRGRPSPRERDRALLGGLVYVVAIALAREE